MKKVFKLSCVAFIALAVLASCSAQESDHVYTTKYEGLMENSNEGKARYEMVCGYINSVDPNYFGKNRSFFGLSSETDMLAWNEFVAACDKIDTTLVKSILAGGEQFRVDLIETQSDSYRTIGAYLINKAAEPEAEKKESE